jgi:hypothetical protein
MRSSTVFPTALFLMVMVFSSFSFAVARYQRAELKAQLKTEQDKTEHIITLLELHGYYLHEVEDGP